jgi:glycosyltransferase involved in cell wall biosynthesis
MFAVQCALLKGFGGVYTSLFHYARMFDRNGVRSVCLYRGPGADALRAGGLDVIEAPAIMTSPFFPLSPELSRLRGEILKRSEPDFFMAHSDLSMRPLHRMFPNAVQTTRCHSDNTKHKRGAELVVTLNSAQQELVEKALPGQRVRLFGNPFVPPAGEHRPSTEGAPNGRVRFNFMGRLEQVKDPATLLRAIATATLPTNIEVRFFGTGSLEPKLREAASLTPLEIEFAGWINEPFSQFDRGDILVLLSDWESYSWVVREALHFSVPVIASDIFVHRDALDGGAFGDLFPVGDAKTLARLLEQAIANPDGLRAKAIAGGAALEARYGAKAFWAKFSAELDTIRAKHAQV